MFNNNLLPLHFFEFICKIVTKNTFFVDDYRSRSHSINFFNTDFSPNVYNSDGVCLRNKIK